MENEEVWVRVLCAAVASGLSAEEASDTAKEVLELWYEQFHLKSCYLCNDTQIVGNERCLSCSAPSK